MQQVPLTGARASVLRAAWWGVLVASLWLVATWSLDAYRVVLACDPDRVRHADAGNGFSLALGLLGAATSGLALVRPAHQGVAAGTLLLGLPIGFLEWMVITMAIRHRCGVEVSAAWFAAPARDAALVLTLAGPALLALTLVLRKLEAVTDTCRSRIPPARAGRRPRTTSPAPGSRGRPSS